MSEALMNVATAIMFAALAFGLVRQPLAEWKRRLQTGGAGGESADRDALPDVPTWVAVAAGVLILGLAVLLVDAYVGPGG